MTVPTAQTAFAPADRPRQAARIRTWAVRGTLVLMGTALTLAVVFKDDLGRLMMRRMVAASMDEMNPPGAELTQLADDLYTFRWLGWRTAFVATPDGVIVFDPVNDAAARRLAEEIRRVAPNPAVRYVIYSHRHRDHVMGAKHFGGSPVVVAQARTAKGIAAMKDPDILPPTEVFEGDRHTVRLGGVEVQLHLLPAGHGDDNVVALIPHRRAVFAVDVVFPDQVPPPNLGPIRGLQAQTAAIHALDFDTLIPGHSRVGTKADVAAFAGFLADTEAAARAAIRKRDLRLGAPADKFPDSYPRMADAVFDIQEALKPKYGRWRSFEYAAGMFGQAVMVEVLMGEAPPAPDLP